MDCSRLTASGKPCRMAPLKGTDPPLCWGHTQSPDQAAARRRGIAVTNANRRLLRAEQSLERKKSVLMEKFAGVDVVQLNASLESLEKWPAYVSGLVLAKVISAPQGQVLLAAGREARTILELKTEMRAFNIIEGNATRRQR